MTRDDNVHEVVVAAGSITEADVITAALKAAGIHAFVVDSHVSNTLAHLGPAINPKGFRVAVPSNEVEAALEVLGQRDVKPDQVGGKSPEDDAVKAMRCTYLSAVFPPLAFIALFYGIRAAFRSREWPVPMPRKAVAQIVLSILISALVVTIILYGLIELITLAVGQI